MSDFDDFEIEDDLGDIPASGDPLPGRYLCQIAKMEQKARRDDASVKYINIQFKIADVTPEGEERLGKFIGRSVFDIYNLSAKALWKLKALVEAVRGPAEGKRVPNLTDEMVVLDVYEDHYDGNVNLRTKGYKSSEGWLGANMDLTGGDEPDTKDDTKSGTTAEGGDAPTVDI